jgi:hypothetical protein
MSAKKPFDRAKEHERRIAWHTSMCAHFTGTQKQVCKAGVNYRALVGGPDFGWATRMPCTGDKGDAIVVCAQLRLTTREEAEAEVARSEDGYSRIATCLAAIKAKHGNARGLADSMPCPTGCGGTLGYTIAGSNGHVWGSCSTQGCARWMM